MGGLFADGEAATSPEDVSKWTVDDVCSFIGGLSGCGEYAPVRQSCPGCTVGLSLALLSLPYTPQPHLLLPHAGPCPKQKGIPSFDHSLKATQPAYSPWLLSGPLLGGTDGPDPTPALGIQRTRN